MDGNSSPQFGLWYPPTPTPNNRRYKFIKQMGPGRAGGKLYRARCERGEMWAIEVLKENDSLSKEEVNNNSNNNNKVPKVSEPAGIFRWVSCPHFLKEEDVYVDERTGIKCIVSRLPKETMRQRVLGASYGIELVLRWARQLATALGALRQPELPEHEETTLDNVWLDEDDCILVGDFGPSGIDGQKQCFFVRKPGKGDAYSSRNGSAQVNNENADDVQVHTEDEQAGNEEVKKRDRNLSISSGTREQPSIKDQNMERREREELQSYGVLMYQVATKIIMSGDTSQIYHEIMTSSEAKDEATGKGTLMRLLYQQLGESSSPKLVECLATIIVDALIGKLVIPDDLDAMVPRDNGVINISRENLVAPPPPAEEKDQCKCNQDIFHFADECSSSSPSSCTPIAPMYRDSNTICGSELQQENRKNNYMTKNPLAAVVGALQQSHDANVKRRALVALRRLGAKAAQNDVLHVTQEILSRDVDPIHRNLTALALGAMGPAAANVGGESVLNCLIRALNDTEASVRVSAAWALGNMGRQGEHKGILATLLHRSLKDPDEKVRDMAGKSWKNLSRVVGHKRSRHNDVAEASSSSSSSMSVTSTPPSHPPRQNHHIYASKRPCLMATTLSMAQASIHGAHFSSNGGSDETKEENRAPTSLSSS